ncbi:hypothetical protein [Thalassotalea litorea]|uniref:hypothetical protein n=1 Tax=Thalassotalea litorea TaxID=2020715 RepID=UPI0037360F25
MRFISKNSFFIFLSLIAFVLFVPTASMAVEVSSTNSLASVLHQTTGKWRGELYYLDYQSGQRFSIPMTVEASLSADQETLIRQVTFTDPENLVYATQLLTLNEQENRLAEAYFKDNQGESLNYDITKIQISDAQHWRVEFQNETLDDERSALVLHYLERKGNKLYSQKKVKYLDEFDGKFIVRNGSKLTLMEH